jgi:hypothetical protein
MAAKAGDLNLAIPKLRADADGRGVFDGRCAAGAAYLPGVASQCVPRETARWASEVDVTQCGIRAGN